MSDGHLNKCIKCTREDIYQNRYKKREYYRAYSKKWSSKPENVEKRKEYYRQYPLRYAAKEIVKNAIKKGTLIKKACEKCGELKVDAHHDDYYNPLGIRWLCRSHHKEWHKENRPIG